MATAKALIATGTAAVGAFAIAGLVLVHHGATQPAVAGKPPPLSSSSMEQWTAAVCRADSFQDGAIGLPNATGTGHCSGRKDGDWIMVGTYATGDLMHNDIARYRGAAYAAIRLTSGELFAFVAPVPQDPTTLAPLAKYGFAVHGH